MPTPENILRVLPRLDETNCWTASEKGTTRFTFQREKDRLVLSIEGIDIERRIRIRDEFIEALRGTHLRDRNPIEQRTSPPVLTYIFRPIPERSHLRVVK